MSQSSDYIQRRNEIEHYFDSTALAAWKKLTGTQPVSGIRATVRAGRDAMRQHFLDYLPQNLSGWRILDAGCGSGVLAFDLASRGADVVAIDLSPKMISFAYSRQMELGIASTSSDEGSGSVQLLAGDMLDPALGDFDAVVSMDALIHYRRDDAVDALSSLCGRTQRAILFTIAPQTLLLQAMLLAGKAFPRSDRSPAIHPVRPEALLSDVFQTEAGQNWTSGRSDLVSAGFYTSRIMELKRR